MRHDLGTEPHVGIALSLGDAQTTFGIGKTLLGDARTGFMFGGELLCGFGADTQLLDGRDEGGGFVVGWGGHAGGPGIACIR